MRKSFFKIGKGIFALLFLFSNLVLSHDFDPQWLKILRYNKTLFGHESEVDYPKYFLSKDGKTDPLKEMQASIKAFNNPPKSNFNNHPICLFPGRYLYLLKHQKVKAFDLKKCTDFQKYRKKLNVNSASIIFSSYYINKPASAFGHTFIKLNQGDAKNSDLKSYGVDFSAQVTTKNPLMYGVMGIFGGFYGRFSLLPYFLKLREYNDVESRDLWEFELNLSKADLELLEAHLWDMNLALFDYYYFTENCSYHVYRFIDAIKPEWNLWDEVYTYLAPIDTIIPLIKKEGVLKNIFLRKSIQKRVHEKLDTLSNKELKFIKESITNKKVANYSDLKKPSRAFDGLIEFMDYKFSKDIHLGESKSELVSFKMKVLKERSQLEESFVEKIKIRKNSFDYGHRPRRMRLNSISSDIVSGFEIEDRTALHNILELKGDAYSDFSLEMGRTSILYDDTRKKLFFNSFTLANVTALRPFTYLEKLLSWQFAVGVKRDEFEIHKISPFANLGLGGTFSFQKSLLSIFAQTYFNEIGRENNIKEELIGVKFLLTKNLNQFAISLGLEHLRDFESSKNDYNNAYLNMNYNLKKVSFFVSGKKYLDIDSFKVGLYMYY